jgi:hypothetical protein
MVFKEMANYILESLCLYIETGFLSYLAPISIPEFILSQIGWEDYIRT